MKKFHYRGYTVHSEFVDGNYYADVKLAGTTINTFVNIPDSMIKSTIDAYKEFDKKCSCA